MTNNSQAILNRFHNDGIFPNDDQLFILLKDRKSKGDNSVFDIYDIELELVFTAMNDQSHPYHHKV